VARKASSKLKGMAAGKMPKGSTARLPITNHIITNPMTQANKVVSHCENFLARTNITNANTKDQTPQMAPLTGAEGKVRPSWL